MDKLVDQLADCAQAHCMTRSGLNAAQRSLMENLIRAEFEKRAREEIEHIENQKPRRIRHGFGAFTDLAVQSRCL